jgi:hypothetical protein
MITSSIGKFTNGWFIGDFEPSLLRTGHFEVAHHRYPRGFRAQAHAHRVATEYNYIVAGDLVASGTRLGPGGIFAYEPGEVADVEFLEDTDLIIIKVPSVPSDKYPV